ncbi:MAG: hypothetical protein SCALA702_27390 [Melioribacteraceae bacterium]|nr:MAG: hypothetical protein SCALA702_27390 [Melioribacteraceae bacterium]
MKKVITESYIIDLIVSGKFELDISDGAIITPLAKDKIKSAGIRLISNRNKSRGFGKTFDYNKIILAYKELSPGLLDSFRQIFFNIRKLGTFKIRRTFPESLTELVKQISLGETDLIFVLTDEPEETIIFANKFPKVRCAVVYDELSLKRVKEKIHPNIIVFDSELLTDRKIENLISLWQSVNTDRAAATCFDSHIFKIEKYFINQ